MDVEDEEGEKEALDRGGEQEEAGHEGEQEVTEEMVPSTPSGSVQASGGVKGILQGLKLNGDPFTPGATPAIGDAPV